MPIVEIQCKAIGSPCRTGFGPVSRRHKRIVRDLSCAFFNSPKPISFLCSKERTLSLHRKIIVQKKNLRLWKYLQDPSRKPRHGGRPTQRSIHVSSGLIDIVQDSVSYTLTGSPNNAGCESKLFPVTDIGENHLSFLTLFPIQVHARVSLRFHSKFNPKEALAIEGNVIYCFPGKYASGYRFQVVVVFDPQCVKDEDRYFNGIGDGRTVLKALYGTAV